jgi:hypothetical protein
MTLRLKRIRCWFRNWHRSTSDGRGKFRYDQIGYCLDCGDVQRKPRYRSKSTCAPRGR